MGLSISPAEMVVAKVVAPRDLERELIFALEEFSFFDFIDVPAQAGFPEARRSHAEETVFVALDHLEELLSSLNLSPRQKTEEVLDIDDSSVQASIDAAQDIVAAIEPMLVEVERDLASAEDELERQRTILTVANLLEPLGLDIRLLGSTEYTYTSAGTIRTANVSRLEWSVRELTQDAYVMRTITQRDTTLVAVSVPIDLKNAVERVFTALGFDEFDIPPEEYAGSPEKIAVEAKEKIQKIEGEIQELEERKSQIAGEWAPRVLALWEQLDIEKQRVEAKRHFVHTTSSVKVWGWIPEGREQDLIRVVEKHVGPRNEVSFEAPDFAEYTSPSYLDNPSFMKPTEGIVSAYGIPQMHDVDPTKVMWLTFPLIFGLVFADVGQGIIILLIGLVSLRARRRNQDWGSIMGYLQIGAEGLIMMGVFATLAGFLFGSFFGAETVIEPLWPVFAHSLPNGAPNPYRSTHLLKLSIEIGAVHIAIGILLNLYNRLKHREIRKTLVAFSYLWLYLGFVVLLFGVSYNDINTWFSSTGRVYLWIPVVGIGFGSGNNGIYPALPVTPMFFSLSAFIVPMSIMALASFGGGVEGVVEFFEYGLGMISHTISYARIFALHTVHAILSSVFISLIPALIEIPFPAVSLFGLEIIPEYLMHEGHEITPYLPLMGAIVGTLIVGMLEGLLAFMHTLRLHFVEWFSKFFHGGGKKYEPFRLKRIHSRGQRSGSAEITQVAHQ
jgi:V/A-type H+-transporting ATPase subunit I